jgi:hypothetical protein
MTATQWIWLAVALPLAGFLVNGALALRRKPAVLPVSIVGPGVLLGAFAVSLGIALGLLDAPPHEPEVVRLWSWPFRWTSSPWSCSWW